MKIVREKNWVRVILDQDLNLFSSKRVKRLVETYNDVQLDLSNANLVDSEGLINIIEIIQSGKRFEILNPPHLLLEIADLLQIDEVVDLRKYIIYSS
jgi:ABC-type transporter Mla MlaB component